MTELRGLTWDHPRGYQALDAFGDHVTWDRQPLEGFESEPIASLAQRYDLVIVDHPGLGDAVQAEALLPLDAHYDASALAAWRAKTVGASFASYELDGHQWALPIDAATQVGVLGAELASIEPPRSWPEALAVAREEPTALCLGGPHAFLMLAALCTALGAAPLETGDDFLDKDASSEAWELLRHLLAVAHPQLSWANPIAVLDAMSNGAATYCPLVFGYVTYQASPSGLRAVDAPAGAHGRIGSVLGGTGVAVSSRSREPEAAAAHAARLLGLEVQRDIYTRTGAQSSRVEVWEDPAVIERLGNFYRATRSTIEAAWVRPRRPGFVRFQSAASEIVRQVLLNGSTGPRCVDDINTAYRAIREAA